MFAIIIGGVLFMSASGARNATINVATSLVGPGRGTALTDLSILTIRSVAKGIVGIAIFQAILSAIGLLNRASRPRPSCCRPRQSL